MWVRIMCDARVAMLAYTAVTEPMTSHIDGEREIIALPCRPHLPGLDTCLVVGSCVVSDPRCCLRNVKAA